MTLPVNKPERAGDGELLLAERRGTGQVEPVLISEHDGLIKQSSSKINKAGCYILVPFWVRWSCAANTAGSVQRI